MLDVFLSNETSNLLLGCALGAVGSLVKYSRDVIEMDDETFKLQVLLLYAVMGCGVGMATSSFIDPEMYYRNGLIIMFGFMANKILAFIDDKSKRIIQKTLGRKFSII